MRKLWAPLQSGMGSRVRNVSWTRIALGAEMVVLLVFAVALTVAPQITLSAIAGVTAEARDFSLSYRPLVALFGLVFTALIAQGLWTWLRGLSTASLQPQALRTQATDLPRSGEGDSSQKAA